MGILDESGEIIERCFGELEDQEYEPLIEARVESVLAKGKVTQAQLDALANDPEQARLFREVTWRRGGSQREEVARVNGVLSGCTLPQLVDLWRRKAELDEIIKQLGG